MPDLWMDVDAALAEVPVNILPLLDDTDFKTRETAVAYNAAGMDLVWNFVTAAGAFTQTVVTPTTGGNYDWTHQGDGVYTIEIPASGGASINNDTEGFGWFTGMATGVLPWRGPIIGFRAAGLNDALIESAWSATRGLAGTALPAAAADAAGGLPVSDAGGLDLDAILADTADMQPKLGAPAGASLAADVAAVKAQTAVIEGDTGTDIPATLAVIVGYIDTEVGAIKAKTDNLPIDPADQSAVEAAIPSASTIASQVRTELATELARIDAAISSRLAAAGYVAPDNATIGAIAGYLDTEIAAIKAKTDNLPVAPAATGDIAAALAAYDPPTKAEMDAGFASGDDAILAAIAALNNLSATQAANAVGALVIEGTITLIQSLRIGNAANAGKVSGAGTTAMALRDLADTVNRIAATVDADGNRIDVTLDLT